jgi:hypothetical protein
MLAAPETPAIGSDEWQCDRPALGRGTTPDVVRGFVRGEFVSRLAPKQAGTVMR